MTFIRENLLKIVVFIIILIVVIVIFVFAFGGKKLMSGNSYSNMEKNMVSAAEKYVNRNKNLLPKDEEVTKVNLDTLETAGFISKYSAVEDSSVVCSGYVEITASGDNYAYVPYLKCGKFYETKTIASYIKDNEPVVTVGDGLYKIGDTYVYRGENPNNYLKIGDRLYRIIEIKDNELRLVSEEKLDVDFKWDDRYNIDKKENTGINDFSKSRLKETFDHIIKYNTEDDESEIKIFSDLEMEKMIAHDVCIGKRPFELGDISTTLECQQIEPNMKLSFVYVGDYARASIDPNCKTIFDPSCNNYNYLYTVSSVFRTITATSDNTYQIIYLYDGIAELSYASNSFNTNIVIYLGASSLYYSGDGSHKNPYTIR